MGVSARAGLRCRLWKTGAEAAGALVVVVLWRMIMKSNTDGIEAHCQISRNNCSSLCGCQNITATQFHFKIKFLT